MAVNVNEILRQYTAAAQLVPSALKKAAKSRAGAETFSEDLDTKIRRREISPTAVSREKEVVSQLFGTPASMEQELREGGVMPTRAGQLIGGRMQTYLDQLDSIRDSRSTRQTRIDDIVKSAASGVKAQSEMAGLEADLLIDQRDEAWKVYKETQRQIEHQESLAKSGNQTDNDRATMNSIISEYGKLLAESSKDPDSDGGMNPNDYVRLLRQAESELGPNGRDWFLERFSPTEAVITSGDNIGILQSGGVNIRDMASRMSASQLKAQMTDDLSSARTEDDFRKIKNFYRDFTTLFGTSQAAKQNKALFKDYMIDAFGSDVMADEVLNRILPRDLSGIAPIDPNTGEVLEIKEE